MTSVQVVDIPIPVTTDNDLVLVFTGWFADLRTRETALGFTHRGGSLGKYSVFR